MSDKQPLVKVGDKVTINYKAYECSETFPVIQEGEPVEYAYSFDGWGDYPILLSETQLEQVMKEQ